MLRLWSWNINGLPVWDELAECDTDVVLLQEAPSPAGNWPRPVAPDPAGGWATAGWLPGRWSRRTAVTLISDRAELALHRYGERGDAYWAGRSMTITSMS